MAPLLIAGIGAGASAIGSGISSLANYYSSKNAANEQRKAAAAAGKDITNAYNTASGYQQPYLQQGQQDYTTLGEMMRGGQFNVNDQFNYQADPGAAFRMQQGTAAINTNAAAKGSGLSTATMKMLAKYGSDLGSQEYQNSYNRFVDQRNFNQNEMSNRFSRQNTMAGYGMQAADNLGNLATGYGNNMADLNIQRGNINAQSAQVPGFWQGLGQQMQSVAPYAMGYGMNQMQQPQTAQGMFNKQYGSSLPRWLRGKE